MPTTNLFRRLVILTAIAAILIPQYAQAWGAVGHKTIAFIAEDHLTPAAKQRIQAILPPDETLATVATWADDIRNARPSTKPWHFINLPVRSDVTASNLSVYCSSGDLLSQIKAEVAALRNPAVTGTARLEALKFLVHFMGDMTMPLHCADDSDRGGNDKFVRFYGTYGISLRGNKIKLHALWDQLIEVEAKEDPRELATSLEKDITAASVTEWGTGSTDDWVLDSYTVAKQTVYAGLSAGPTAAGAAVNLPRRYYSAMRPVAEIQLEKAGIRLAALLNGIFGFGQ